VLLFFLGIALDTQVLLCFHMNVRMDFSISVKRNIENFHGDYTESVDCSIA
jgi:hypothetical protein